jgi:hypothetical protein
MKIIVALLAVLGFGLSLVAQPYPSDKGSTAPKATPGVKASPGGKAAKKEEPPKIDGMEVARPGKGFLGVQIANGGFKINFYDAEKKPVPPDVARALLRWDPKNKVGQERLVLNPGAPFALSNPKVIRPPYTFKLFITLLKEGAADGAESPVGESYVIDFRQ